MSAVPRSVPQWRATATACLARARTVSSLTLDEIPYQKTLESCNLVVVLPFEQALFDDLKQYSDQSATARTDENPWRPEQDTFSQHVIARIRTFSSSFPDGICQPYLPIISEDAAEHNFACTLRPTLPITMDVFYKLQEERLVPTEQALTSVHSRLDSLSSLQFIEVITTCSWRAQPPIVLPFSISAPSKEIKTSPSTRLSPAVCCFPPLPAGHTIVAIPAQPTPNSHSRCKDFTST
jgi:hypothetical protein